jgi:hypothetical protein
MSLSLILRAGPWLAILLLLAMFARANDKAKDWKRQADHCAEARKLDRRTYEQAQKDAAAKNEAQVRRIESEQDRITNEVRETLNARLERLRRELRSAAPSAQGAPRSPQAGPDGKAPGGADGEARVCLAPSEFLRGAENEERHDRLIDWVEKQLQIQR